MGVIREYKRLAVYTPNMDITEYKIGDKCGNGLISNFEDISRDGILKVELTIINNNELNSMVLIGLPFALLT